MARSTAAQRTAPQRFREEVRALKQRQGGQGWRTLDARAELLRIRPLIRRAERLADPQFASRRARDLEAVHDAYDRAVEMIRSGDLYPARGSGFLLAALEQVMLRPAFKEGDRTPRGIIEHIQPDYSRSSGWLYGVRDSRGVYDSVWESTLVWPLL